jgi:hypothetical protein
MCNGCIRYNMLLCSTLQVWRPLFSRRRATCETLLMPCRWMCLLCACWHSVFTLLYISCNLCSCMLYTALLFYSLLIFDLCNLLAFLCVCELCLNCVSLWFCCVSQSTVSGFGHVSAQNVFKVNSLCPTVMCLCSVVWCGARVQIRLHYTIIAEQY